MATLEQHPESGRYHLRFRFQSRSYRRSLKTDDTIEAEGVLARATETLRLIERGRIEIPQHVDIVEFLLSDGKVSMPLEKRSKTSLAKLFDRY